MTMSLYEIGYFDNDFRTVAKEKNPTIRADEKRDWLKKRLFSIISVRLIIAIVMFVFLFNRSDSHQQMLLSVLIAILIAGFYFHNTLRSRCNVVTYFIIVTVRYLIPTVAAIDSIYYQSMIPFIIFVFPLLRTIEHACKDKYAFQTIKQIVRNPDVFRVKWYIALTFILVVVYFLSATSIILSFVALSTYFLIYRAATLYASKSTKILRTKHQSYNWDKNEK
ncbi:hypothetical protein [Lelliottia wanjuensis]|uniref:Uncharacterized protein n=1 Tax=Lelliottia wanjuensis TaxID=3050585 RepID=A0AAP4CZC4_9ENTR|nr:MULTISPECIES: hypothetical protein [unclassified Lelliottia]MDK9362296.1 hypothetical protein [Lelliottia sp. V106_12]MDK9616893.1 hypothetical protein [Lelliottia sp. V106_9]